VQSRSDYRDYQKTTSAFLPWPPNTPPFAKNPAPATSAGPVENL